MKVALPSSSTALMIWTQVVAVMPPNSHVERHQHADDHHRIFVAQAEQQFDQLARADHLRDQVEGTTTSVLTAAKQRTGVCAKRKEAT